jgi:hypothetical protein
MEYPPGRAPATKTPKAALLGSYATICLCKRQWSRVALAGALRRYTIKNRTTCTIKFWTKFRRTAGRVQFLMEISLSCS